jgi:hypothetical protein
MRAGDRRREPEREGEHRAARGLFRRKLTRRVAGILSYTLSRSMRTAAGRRFLSSYDRPHYERPDGTVPRSFGDFVRALFRFTIQFRTEEGICIGNGPGAE